MEKNDEKKVVKQEIEEKDLEQATGAGTLHCPAYECQKIIDSSYAYYFHS